jgi:hypothetical protein
MNLYQITKNGVAITGALTYLEALQVNNELIHADMANVADYGMVLAHSN